MNLQVNLTKRVKTPIGLRYCPAVESANGRIKPDWVDVNGTLERHPEGAYYLDWYEGSKRKRLSVGKDSAQAYNQKLRKQAELNAVSQGLELVQDSPAEAGNLISTAIANFLEETRLSKKLKTLAAYKTALDYFQESLSPDTAHIEDLKRVDMLRFSAYLRDTKDQSPRSVWNKFSNVMSFLKANDVRGIVGKNDWPKYVEEEPEVFDRAEVEKLFSACDTQERLYFQFFLMTGMREQEVIYTTWADVNFVQATVTVRWKAEYAFSPKNYKEREIPIPEKLLLELKAAKIHAIKGCPLLFPTSGCKPKFDFLHILKAITKRAGLDPERFWLHKFRATFATWHLWAGVDLRTVQTWLGHSDMESTMRYLKPARGESMRARVDATFA